jgi:hypothetical protein
MMVRSTWCGSSRTTVGSSRSSSWMPIAEEPRRSAPRPGRRGAARRPRRARAGQRRRRARRRAGRGRAAVQRPFAWLRCLLEPVTIVSCAFREKRFSRQYRDIHGLRWTGSCPRRRANPLEERACKEERRGRDLNPRSAVKTDNGFRDRRIRPLCHPSERCATGAQRIGRTSAPAVCRGTRRAPQCRGRGRSRRVELAAAAPRRPRPRRTKPRRKRAIPWRSARRSGRVAEGGALLRRYRGINLYRGFESLLLRFPARVQALCCAQHKAGSRQSWTRASRSSRLSTRTR